MSICLLLPFILGFLLYKHQKCLFLSITCLSTSLMICFNKQKFLILILSTLSIFTNLFLFFVCFVLKYILFIMLLQLSQFFLPFILLLSAPSPSPSSIPPVHVLGSYILVLWLLHFLYYS